MLAFLKQYTFSWEVLINFIILWTEKNVETIYQKVKELNIYNLLIEINFVNKNDNVHNSGALKSNEERHN